MRRLAVVLWAAASLATAPLAAQAAATETIVIRSLARHVTEAGAELRFAVSRRSPEIRLASRPGGTIVLTLPRHRLAPGLDRIAYDDGLVASVELRQQETATGVVTEVWVRTRGDATSTVRPGDEELRLELYRVDEPVSSPATGAIVPQGESAAAAATEPSDLQARLDRAQEEAREYAAQRDALAAELERLRRPAGGRADGAPGEPELRVSFDATPCLNLRQTASLSGRPLDCLRPGTALTLVESAGTWRRVRDPSGSVGWVAAAFLETIAAGGAAASPVPPAAPNGAASQAALQAQLEEARAAIGHYVDDRDELLSRLEEATAERDALRRSAAAEDAARQALVDDLERARSELGEALARGAESDRSATLAADLETARAAERSLAARLDNAQQALSDYAKARSDLNERIERLERERQGLSEELASARADRDAARVEVETARREAADRAADAGGLVVSNTAEPCLHLRAAPAAAEMSLDCLLPGTRLQILASRPEWLRVRLANGREGWTAAEYVTATAAGDVAAARQELERLRETAERLQLELSDAVAARDAARQQLRAAGDAVAAAERERDELAARLERERAARQRLEAQAAAAEPAEARADELATQLEQTAAELSTARTAAADAERLRRELETARADAARQTEDLRRARDELESARASAAAATELAARLEAAGAAVALRISAAAAPCLRLRPAPEPGSRSIDCLPPGTSAWLLDRRGDWHRVRLDDGRTGWMAAAFLEDAGVAAAQRATELGRELARRLTAAQAERDAARQARRQTEERLQAALAEVATLRTEASGARAELWASEEARAALSARLSERESRSAAAETAGSARQRQLEATRPPSPAARPAATPTTTGDSPEAAVAAAVESWARAWSEQRLDDYFAAYARDFQPAGGLSREAWAPQRRSRLRRPGFIELTLGAVDVTVDGDRAVARFEQSYRSDTYADRVHKELVLVLEAGNWKILAERAVERLR